MGGSRRSPEASLATRRLTAVLCMPRTYRWSSTGQACNQHQNMARRAREKTQRGEYGVVLYIPRTEAKHYEPECVQVIFLGLRGERSCDYGIASAETDKIPTPKTTLPL